MKNSLLGAVVPATIAVLVVAMLGGCAPATTSKAKPGHGHTTSSSSSTPTPSPTAKAPDLGPLPANALFRITATVTEPGGAMADLVQTVFAPAAPTASDTALLNAQCNFDGQPTWQSNYTNPLYVTTTVTATLRTGSKPWSSDDQVASYFLGGASAFSGSYEGAQAPCADGYITIPGTMHGVAAVDSSDPAMGTYGWASQFGDYGFDGGGNYPDAEESSGTGVVGDCAIEESAAAKALGGVIEGWLTQPFDAQYGCVFQGADPA
ncbi:MAG: hypothetical protein QOD50_1343 [Actinomycetota bacterium]|jgi:hypothetical protein|nr:hypothetical protein [Actinomycetota bacterium]